MKRNILIFTIFMLIGMLYSIHAQEYYIEGFYERHGEGMYTLENVHSHGIYINGQTSLSETIHGIKSSIKCGGLNATMVKFSFERATTDCRAKWENGFIFQYWDEDNNKWKTDVEACRNSDANFSQKEVCIMLVLDYSSSMRENIELLQASAINFINAMSNASNGNVHLGIIAFSGMDMAKKQVFPITPLKKDNKFDFERFVRNSNKGQETALYYSVDKAMQMVEEYVSRKHFSKEEYNGSFLITFTDGLDNASINDDISVSMHRGRKNEYLAYISKQLTGYNRKQILGRPLEHFAIGYTGSENFTKEDKDFFRDVLQQTTPDEDHFKLASHFDEVEIYFKYIIRNLTDRWENLNMYIGESQHGRIRWVLDCGVKKAPPQIKGDFWMGIGLEIGGYDYVYRTYYDYYHYEGIAVALRTDFAFPFKNRFALGATLSLGIDEYEEFIYRLGPLAKYTFPNGSALIAGGGIDNWYPETSIYFTSGFKFKSPWYINASYSIKGEIFTLGVGYSIFGGR